MKTTDGRQNLSAFTSRRNFLKAAAFAGSMLALTGCKNPSTAATAIASGKTVLPANPDGGAASATPKPEFLPPVDRNSTILRLPAPGWPAACR
jgi:hypothetical protein